MAISDLWYDGNEKHWIDALSKYYTMPSVKRNIELEQRLNSITPEIIQNLSPHEFYDFLYYDYFPWKYTANNRLSTTRKQLEKYLDEGFDRLEDIKQGIFKSYNCDPEDTDTLLYKTIKIHGLGVAGASGFLSILFPNYYGTVDQFLVKALCSIPSLPSKNEIEKMNANNLTIDNGNILETILRNKAKELNIIFRKNEWTPRKLDMILWSYER